MSEPVVYLIGANVDGGMVKIGKADCLKSRFGGIRTMSPVELRVLTWARGGLTLERELHRRFAALRLHGEWFAAAPEIFEAFRILRRSERAERRRDEARIARAIAPAHTGWRTRSEDFERDGSARTMRGHWWAVRNPRQAPLGYAERVRRGELAIPWPDVCRKCGVSFGDSNEAVCTAHRDHAALMASFIFDRANTLELVTHNLGGAA